MTVEQSYSADEVVQKFAALCADLDFIKEMQILGVSRWHFLRRRQLEREFRALYVGLWRLALVRSFPQQHVQIFHAYMLHLAKTAPSQAQAGQDSQLVLQYVELLRNRGDSDFSEASRHLLSLVHIDEKNIKALILKLALHIRARYDYFFRHLV